MKSLRHKPVFRENALVAALFLGLAHLLYYRTAQAGFVTDFTGLLHRMDGARFSGVWDCFGFPALHQVTNFFLFFFVKWFGTGGLGWYLVFTSLHVANGLLGFVLAKKIFGKSGYEQPFWPALMASLLFLVLPYQVEAVVWRVCFNFLFCSLNMLASLFFLLKYLEGEKRWHLLWSHGLFVVALFTFELAVALPFMALTIAFFYDKKLKIKQLALPYAILLAAYFLLNKLVLGGWAGHYGEGVHLNADLRLIASNCLKYFTKYLLGWREWPHGKKEAMVLFLEKPMVAWAGLAFGLAGFAALILYKKTGAKLRLVGMSWLLFFLAIAPVSNLYVAYVLHGENDRYGYLASLFFSIGLVGVFDFFPRLLRNGLFTAWLLAAVFFQQKMAAYWQQGAQIVNGLLHDFRWQDAPEVYVLACPENLQGIPMFKDFSRENLALKHALRYVGGKPSSGDFYQVAQFNLNSPADRFTASRDDSTGVFRLQFQQWGNWWWLHGMGLGDYQTPQYRFRTDGNGCRVEMKAWPPVAGAVFIVAQGDRWQEL